METVWRDAEEPVQYKSSRMSTGFFVELLYPIVAFLIACAFVVMSYYIAPSTVTIDDKPIIEVPKYYYINSNFKDSATKEFYSELGCNFPPFQNKEILLYGNAPIFHSSVDPYGRVTIKFEILTTDEIQFSQILLPVALKFTKFDRPTLFTYIPVSIPNSVAANNEFDVYGNVDLRQTGTFEQSFDNLTALLSQLKGYDGQVFSLQKIYDAFDESPISANFIETRRDFKANTAITDRKVITVHFQVPTMSVNAQAPYWNILRNTYVQLFYWLWVTVSLLYPFIDAAFKYHVIHTTSHKLIKPNPKFKAD